MAYIYENGKFTEYEIRSREEAASPLRVLQIVPSICRGDVISNDALEIYKELADHRIQTHIYAEHIGIGISSRRVSPLLNLPKLRKEDIVIYHMTTESGMYEYIRRIKKEYGCEIIFRYHSITPAQYFRPFSEDMADQCSRGLKEAEAIRDIPTEVLALSDHDRKQLRSMGYTCPIMILPPLVSLAEYSIEPAPSVLKEYPPYTHTNLLYVGQMIPHKRIERLMELYDVYCRTKDPDARLFLVGSISEVPEYYTYLEEYRKKLGYKENQIILTGHVAFNEMIAYYRIADAFVCMSEEEGFGMALVEAMFYHVPVIAYESGAVPETLGGSGVLLPTCKPDEIAEVLDSVIRNPATREQIITGQLRRVESFIESKPRRELIRVLESIQK